jgi:AcrR family transcriptional regulator
MSTTQRRRYDSQRRSQAAGATKTRVLNAAKALFATRGIDRVTIAQIAAKAKVAVPTVYALYKSKEGLLRALMESALFGPRFQAEFTKLDRITDPIESIALTAHVSRAIYESESTELGLLRGASTFSPGLKKMEKEFEELRLKMQKPRLELLFQQSRQSDGLGFEEARRILWMYTSRDVYRMLVHEAGWTPDRYQEWLSSTLLKALAREP